MTENDVVKDKLKLFWDFFFKAETGTYEKSTWLDLFLAEFLVQLNSGAQAKNIIDFCPHSGVVTLVGCELLCSIHRVTSSINTLYTVPVTYANLEQGSIGHSGDGNQNNIQSNASEGEETLGPFMNRKNLESSTEILQRYLLGGLAWKCLILLNTLGVEGSSCCRQLSSVLIWLLGELGSTQPVDIPSNIQIEKQNVYVPQVKEREPIHALFSNKIWYQHKWNGNQGGKITSATEKLSLNTRHKRVTHADSMEDSSKRKSNKENDKSSESWSSTDDLRVLNRSLAMKVWTASDDFEYFDSPRRLRDDIVEDSLYSDPFYVPKKSKPRAEDFMTEQYKEVIHSEISQFQFTLLVTELLQELCKAESSLSGSEGAQISMQCINFALRNLCAFQFGSSPVSSLQYSPTEVAQVKAAFTKLLMVALDKVLIRQDLCAKLINNGTLPMFLRLLEDTVFKVRSKILSKEGHIQIESSLNNENEADNILKYVFGICYSVTVFFYSLLMHRRSMDKIREFMEQFKLYAECLKGGLLKECIGVMLRIPGTKKDDLFVLTKKLLESIGRLIGGMKRVRSEVTHSAACPRSRHKICRARVSAGTHHHHDILGEANTGPTLGAGCCISTMYGTLISLLVDEAVSSHAVLRNKILHVMLNCGACCCVAPGPLMENIVRLILTRTGVASLCLSVLEHTVYGDLGASVLLPRTTDQLPCIVCEPDRSRFDAGTRSPTGPMRDSQRNHMQGYSGVEKKSAWSFLIHYNSLLQLDNDNNVLHATVAHLLRVTPRCRLEMKYELLFSVIYPTFIVAKHRYIIRMEESAYFLTVSCLNIFASLLNTVSFAEQFIQKGGLSYVLELVSLSEFSNQCCSILEVAIVVEIFKLIKENPGEFGKFREMESLASVQMLFKSLKEVTDKCYKIYKLKLPVGKFEELCDLSPQRKILKLSTEIETSERKFSRELSVPSSVKGGYNSENSVEYLIDGYIDILKNVWTFWKTCSGLCLYSPMFREYIVNDPAFMDTYSLLKILFYYLCNCECTVAEMRIIIKILEALLTIQFSVSDLTRNKCKEATIWLLRDAFLAETTLCAQSNSLRAICEMLIRVATTCASADHVMPPLNKAKLPPLLCASVSSDLEHSSSEDSLAGPYASEHSEPNYYTADEGYEADVEIGKFDVASSNKSRKFSPISYMDTGSSLEHSDFEGIIVDYNEYTKTGAVNHPELCIIVVDILTQLIQKLITIKPDDASTNIDISKMGVGLARVCCARLSAALARPLRSVAAMRSPDLNVIERLLSGPSAALLTTKCEQLEELQKSILDLVHVLATQSITPSELAAYLKLFKAEKPPLTVLLTSLSRLVDSAQPDMPDCILCFPIDRFSSSDVATHVLSEEMDYVVVNSTASQSHQAESVARRLYEQHLQSGTISCWSRSALRCGVEGAGWGLWLQGFATALWLRVRGPDPKPDAPEKCEDDEHSDWETQDEWQSTPLQTDSTKRKSQRKESVVVQKSSDLVHVFSIGYDSLMFEVWMDTLSGVFTFKLTRPELNANKVLSETSVESNMPLQQWNCIAFNVKEIVHKRKIHIQVTLFVNGCECETVSLPLQGILIRKVMPTNVLMGDVSPPSRSPAWYLASMTLLRAPVLNTYNAMYLAAHGPNASVLGTKQVRCQTPNYPSLLTPNILDSNVDWDQVYEMSSMNIRDLQDNLLLTFSAQSPTIMNLYHQTTSIPTVFSSRVGTTAGLMGSSSGSSPPGVGTMSTIPETLFVVWNGTPLPSQYRGLPPAAYMLGGPDVLLYLFARVVELDGSAEEQALALSILLRLCRSDNRLHSMFYEHDALSMLHVVMASNKCCMTHHLLKTLLDEACNSPVLVNSSGRFFILTRSDAVVVEPKFLVFMIRAWRDLERPQEFGQWDASRHADVQYPPSVWMYERTDARHEPGGGLLGTLLLALHVLLRDEHPRRAFNAYQMNRVNVLQHLLLACKERFLNSEYGALSDTVACSLVELVRALLGSPPLLCHLALLVDFLVLMHQASDTFVTHSRANFYFLLTSETQAAGEFNLLNFMSKKRSLRKTRKRSESITSLESAYAMRELSKTKSSQISPSNSMDARCQNNVEPTKESMQGQEKDTEKSQDSENAYEASKELKGLINMQIKTKLDKESSGKHKSSSLSDSSDLGPDYDDLESTTVDMFSSGIYHQQARVRAGGSPGWAACEGLLQLLHDIISVMPDTTLNQALGVVIQADTLLVLGNHREASVRAAVVRVVCALMRRSPPEEGKRLDAMLYCHHLADQIALYNASWELAAACAMLLTKRDAPLEDQLDDESWADVTEKSIMRSSPLLAILPCSINDVPLAHNITLAVKKIIDKGSLKALNDVGVTEVVIKTMRVVGLMSDTTFEGRELVLDDLRSLLNRVAIKALMSQHNMQTITEIHYLLTFVEMSERERAKVATNATTCINASEVVRDGQCALFEAQLDHLEEKLHSAYSTQSSHANYFTAVISSAVSLSSEPGAWTGTAGHLPRSEFAARHRAVVMRAVQFVVNRDPNIDISPMEMALVERLFSVLLDAVTGTTSHRSKWWVSMGADWTTPLHDLFYWLMSPNARSERLKAAILRRVYLAPPALHNTLTPADPSGQRKLAVYLLSTLKQVHASTTLLLELPITDWCRSWALATQAQLSARVNSDTLSDEATRLAVEDEEKRTKTVASTRSNIGKVVFSKDALASKLTETAMSITRQVVDIQNGERKAFMDHLRRSQSETVACTQRWQKLIDTYTHEQALWYHDSSYPESWELDPTEGPGRIRVRLRRCHLNISKRFFKKEYKEKAERGSRPSPLSYLFTSPLSVVHSGLVARLHLNETVSYMSRVTYVTVASDRPGELLLSDRCIHFVPEDADHEEDKREKEESAKICEVESRTGSGCSMHAASALSWPLDLVTSVVTRRWCLQEHAVELFLSTGHAHLVAFQDIQDRNAFLKALNNCHLPNRSEAETLTEAMTLWRNGNITNWEYLMKLNGLAGRSYNDLMQYPVLPFVLADYTSRILDLSAPSSFRDLSKPMAVQNKNREVHYINTYNDLRQARREGTSPLLNREPHHYASLYSNSGAVLHYLVRLPPFTPLFLNYQDNNFDMPDRTFHSLQTTWRLITKDSPTDVKELIPEFFYLPEFLKNNEGLNLGVRQCGAAVDDVELPPWAADARLFTLIHRQALESAIVTEHLPFWIDLVFGYKQTGQAAVDAINVFPACTYYGFDPTALEDEVERTAAQAQVRTYGQTPRQLLRHPHPHHTTDLAPHDTASVWAGVENGRWGVYCGSPSQPTPAVLTSRACGCAARLNALPAPRAVAVGARGSIVIALPQQHQRGGGGVTSGTRYSLALLTWGHTDSMVRLKRRRDSPPELLMHVHALDAITTVATSCMITGCPVFFGHASGRVAVIRARPEGSGGASAFRPRAVELRAHTAPIVSVYVCAAFSVVVTASRDGRIVVWDLNTLSYVRTIPNREMLAVTSVTASETLCDVASVHDFTSHETGRNSSSDDTDGYEKSGQYRFKSLIRVHTVNGAFVGSVKVVERVSCVCYSNAPEGISVNCVAVGLDTGAVRLFSSWDLRPVAYIAPVNPGIGLMSITYSVDSQQLFAGRADGAVIAWESGTHTRPGSVRILSAHAIF